MEPQPFINWTLVIVAVIAAIPGSLAAYWAWRSRNQSKDNAAGIQKLEISVDGKLADLLAAREDAADAKGQLKERNAERAHLLETPNIAALHTTEDPLNVKLVEDDEK